MTMNFSVEHPMVTSYTSRGENISFWPLFDSDRDALLVRGAEIPDDVDIAPLVALTIDGTLICVIEAHNWLDPTITAWSNNFAAFRETGFRLHEYITNLAARAFFVVQGTQHLQDGLGEVAKDVKAQAQEFRK